MNGALAGGLIFAGILALVVLRMPMTVALLLPGCVAYWAMASEAALVNALQSATLARLTGPELQVIALVLLMGQFALQGGLARGLFQLGQAFLGHRRAGLGLATLWASAGFGAPCGSSDAATATITRVAYPELKQRSALGMHATGLLAAAGSLGLVLPLSVPLLAYALLTGQALAPLLVAALVPGVLALLAALLPLGLLRGNTPTADTASSPAAWAIRWRALCGVLPTLLVLALVLGGICLGRFTPLQGAAWGALGTLVAAVLQGSLCLKAFAKALLGTLTMAAMVLMVFVAADMLQAALALSGLPATLAGAVLNLPPWLGLALLLLAVLALSSLLDELPLLLVSLPLVFPVIMALDLWGLPPAEKALWFGTVMLGTLQVGLLLPPLGRNLQVVHSICRGVPAGAIYRSALPFLATALLRLALLLGFPSLSLGLVRWVFV